jgi:sugar lactone lactonase YvrE
MPHDASELSIRRIAGAYRAKLGESPVWTEDGRLAFVDIVAKELLVVTAADAADAADATPKRVRLPTTPGCLVRSKKGGLLVALTVDDAAPDQPGGRLCRVQLPPDGTNASGVAGGDVQDVQDVQDVRDVDPKTIWVCDVLNKNLHPALDDPSTPRTVLNDGAVDARGRVWVGSKLLSARAPKPGDRGEPPGAVFCCESAFAFRDGAMTTVGSAQTVREIGGVHTSNGLGWSPCGSVMYHADSPRRRVDAYDFDARSGALSSPRVFCEIADGGVPDGLAVDAEGGVWVCVWDGGRVERWVPSETSSSVQSQTASRAGVTSDVAKRTATRDRTLDLAAAVNVSRPTSCCFGEGAFAETLFVTSCAFDDTVEGHNAVDLAGTEPNAGAVFAVDVGVRGAPTHAAAF